MANLMTIYENFKKALLRLEEVLNLPDKNEIIRDSAIQRFEFTFDLAWKTLKVYLEEQFGVICKSPKGCFREAFYQGILPYDEYWIEICNYRNLTSHLYAEEMAEKVWLELPKILHYFKKLADLLAK